MLLLGGHECGGISESSGSTDPQSYDPLSHKHGERIFRSISDKFGGEAESPFWGAGRRPLAVGQTLQSQGPSNMHLEFSCPGFVLILLCRSRYQGLGMCLNALAPPGFAGGRKDIDSFSACFVWVFT